MLNTVLTGAPTQHPPLLIVHGLFGSARNWGAIAKRMAESRQVITVDMRNHGQSPRADSQSYHDMAGDLAEVIMAHGGHADVVGHSMGGKAAMVLTLTRPELVRRLLVGDIAPVAYTHSQSHLIAAMRGVDLSAVSTRSDADRALQSEVTDRGTRAFLLQSLDVKEKMWRLNLDVLDAEMSGITGWPQIDGQVETPALFLSGAESDYVLPEHRERIKGYFPNARFAKLPGAGHWLHADKPREFVATLHTWFDA
ncbi:alpha/beta fold hydrolase [Psychromarinibacter sp. S121]|uniref:alpha/beta fold hydrolase n=1 Tax=Psychromarinibacter sp. S121 TaxID=3415127 RepID=UPI003C7C0A0A